jgi:hypothetical protein
MCDNEGVRDTFWIISWQESCSERQAACGNGVVLNKPRLAVAMASSGLYAKNRPAVSF